MQGFARLRLAFALGASSIAALGACSGKSESGDGDDAAAGVGGSDAGGGSAGSSSGGASGAGSNSGGASGSGGSSASSSGGASGSGGSSGSSSGGGGSGGASGSGGAPMCAATPVAILCVRGTPDGENERIDVGDPLRIEIRPGGCHSSSCTEPVVSTCSVLGTGTERTVTGEFCLASTADPGVGCTDDCGGGGYASCESDEPLEAGDYTVTLGDLSVSFTVPGSLGIGAACDGSQF